MKLEDLDFYINYLEKNIYSKRALLTGLIVISFLITIFVNLIDAQFINIYRVVLLVVAGIIWLLYWIIKRRTYPKVSSGKIGLILSVETEKNIAKSKVYDDFIDRLNKNIIEKGLIDRIELVTLNEYQSKQTSKIVNKYSRELEHFRKTGSLSNSKAIKNWHKHQNRIKGHFYIYGKIRKRLDVKEKYFLDFDGLVLHKPIKVKAHKQFTEEFITSWFKRISFQEIVEFRGFEISADLIFLIVQYITGLAALISGDPFLALNLHESLSVEIGKTISKLHPIPPNLDKIRTNLLPLVAEESLMIATQLYNSNKPIPEVNEYLDKSFKAESRNYGGYLLQAIIDFVDKKDSAQAFKNVLKAKKLAKNDHAWQYSYAFLLMWQKNYIKAANEYKKIEKKSYEWENITVSEVCRFNQRLIKAEKFIPGYYIIGFLKYKKSKNLPEALEAFEKFISLSQSDDKYSPLFSKAKSYLGKIKSEMNLE